MMDKEEWIKSYVARTPHLLGKCLLATVEMNAAFDDLRIVKGHVETSWGRRGHAWLVDGTGQIFDPTAKQFQAVFEYDAWEPGGEVRTGKCMNCGNEIWRAVQSLDFDHSGETICGNECHEAFTKYLEAENTFED